MYNHDHQVKNVFDILTATNVMNYLAINNSFKSDNSTIANIKTQYYQIMTTILSRILKFKPVIKKPIVTNHTFFIATSFSNIPSFKSILS